MEVRDDVARTIDNVLDKMMTSSEAVCEESSKEEELFLYEEAEWHWGRFFSKFFGFPLPISFHHCSISIYHHPMRCAIAPTKQHIITTSVLS
jgi:hypothetical protein